MSNSAVASPPEIVPSTEAKVSTSNSHGTNNSNPQASPQSGPIPSVTSLQLYTGPSQPVRWFHDPDVRKSLGRLPKTGFRLFGRPFFLGPEDLLIPLVIAAVGDIMVFVASLVSRIVYQHNESFFDNNPLQCSQTDAESADYLTWMMLAAWSANLVIDLAVIYITPKTNMFVQDWRHRMVTGSMYLRFFTSLFLVIMTGLGTKWYKDMSSPCLEAGADSLSAIKHLSNLMLSQIVISWLVSLGSIVFFIFSFIFASGQGKNLDATTYLKRLKCLLCCFPENASLGGSYTDDTEGVYGVSEDGTSRGTAFDAISALFAQLFRGDEPAHLVPSDLAVALVLVHGAQQLLWLESGHQRLVADHVTRWEDKDAQTVTDIALARSLKHRHAALAPSNDHQSQLRRAEQQLMDAAAQAAIASNSINTDVEETSKALMDGKRTSSGQIPDAPSGLSYATHHSAVKRSGYEFTAADALERNHEQSLIATVLAGAQPELQDADWLRISEARRYARFANGAYGWPLYAFENGICKTFCTCQLCYVGCGRPSKRLRDEFGRRVRSQQRTCCGPVYDKELLKNSGCCQSYCCNCSAGVFLKRSGIPPEDILAANLESVFGTVCYYVVRDRVRRKIVVAVRGTLSVGDTLTDLDATTVPIFIDDPLGETQSNETDMTASSSTAPAGAASSGSFRTSHNITREERDFKSDLHVGATALAAASVEPNTELRAELAQIGAMRLSTSGQSKQSTGSATSAHASSGSLAPSGTSETNASNSVDVSPPETAPQSQHQKPARLRTTYYTHSGIARSSLWLWRELFPKAAGQNNPKAFDLSLVLDKYPDHSLVICGHSLGGAVTTILTALLMEKYPDMRGYAFAPPPCVDRTLAERLRPNLTSIIYGADIIGRLSLPSIFKLKRQMRSAFMVSHWNKFDIFKCALKFKYRDMFVTEATVEALTDPPQKEDARQRIPPHWMLDEDRFTSVYDDRAYHFISTASPLSSDAAVTGMKIASDVPQNATKMQTSTFSLETKQDVNIPSVQIDAMDPRVTGPTVVTVVEPERAVLHRSASHRVRTASVAETSDTDDHQSMPTVVAQTLEVDIEEEPRTVEELRARAWKIPLKMVPEQIDKHPHAFALVVPGRIYHIVPNHAYTGADRDGGFDAFQQPGVLERVLHDLATARGIPVNRGLNPESRGPVTPEEAVSMYGAADYLKDPKTKVPLRPKSLVYPAHARMFEEIWVSGRMFVDHLPEKSQLHDIELPEWARRLSELSAADFVHVSDPEDPSGLSTQVSPGANAHYLSPAHSQDGDEDDDAGEESYLGDHLQPKHGSVNGNSPNPDHL